MTARRARALPIAGAVLLLGVAVGLQVARDRRYPRDVLDTERMLYVRSGEALERLALSFDALAADMYWIRAIQHYGGDRLTAGRERKYELLYPLLDLTTSLDPYFTIAYRFGAIFLSEPQPGGPGRPDLAVALLRKGIAAQPQKWQYYHDTGFVNYLHVGDYAAAAEWFRRAAAQPTAPNWLLPIAAAMLQQGNDRTTARALWQQILQSDEEWLRRTAERRLLQLDAQDLIDRLAAVVRRFPPAGGQPYSWDDFARRRVLIRVPLDPTGTPLAIDPGTGDITLSERSPLWPMPADPRRSVR